MAPDRRAGTGRNGLLFATCTKHAIDSVPDEHTADFLVVGTKELTIDARAEGLSLDVDVIRFNRRNDPGKAERTVRQFDIVPDQCPPTAPRCLLS